MSGFSFFWYNNLNLYGMDESGKFFGKIQKLKTA
mgnify:CR=1 FL=1